jgi:tripartite-type tricarboxylate transporter receptor subunit TctC
VKAAAPDGNTILRTPVALMSVYQHVYKALAYDPIADIGPVSQAATFGFAVAVGPQVPAARLAELVAWVKADPARGSYGTPGAGTLPHFLAVSFARATGLDPRHVGYSCSAASLTDLVGGQFPLLVTTGADVLESHKAGRNKVLATSDSARSPFLKGVPTLKEAGFDLVATGSYGVFAPAGTPDAVVARLSAGAERESLAGRRAPLSPTWSS